MADTTGKEENAIWPMPQFYFQVKWGTTEIHFSEISGLDNESQIIEYRHGNSPCSTRSRCPASVR